MNIGLQSGLAAMAVMGMLFSGHALAREKTVLATQGEVLFAARCSNCHDNSAHMLNDIGPALFGVYGRRVGSIGDYDYSVTLKQARARHEKWTAVRLNCFLEVHKEKYKDTRMPMSLSDAGERKAVIAYLKTLK